MGDIRGLPHNMGAILYMYVYIYIYISEISLSGSCVVPDVQVMGNICELPTNMGLCKSEISP